MLANLLTCLVLSTAQGGEYTYEAIPLPGISQANGINNRRQVVGFTIAMGPPQAFLYENGEATLFSFPGAPATLARGINDTGAIVGSYSLTGAPDGQRAFIRDASGEYTSFQYPGDNTVFTVGVGINNKGDIVGFYLDSSDLQLHGFVRYADGRVSAVDHPAANGLSIALGINSRGTICGVRNDAFQGFPEIGYCISGGSYQDVLVPGATSTNVTDINNRGCKVGNYHPTDNNPFAPGGPAYLLCGTGVTEIVFPGVEDTDAYGVNDWKDVVGSFFPDDLGPPFAFVAYRNTRMSKN
jgi:probable HAF family extracellular repeat protein